METNTLKTMLKTAIKDLKELKKQSAISDIIHEQEAFINDIKKKIERN